MQDQAIKSQLILHYSLAVIQKTSLQIKNEK